VVLAPIDPSAYLRKEEEPMPSIQDDLRDLCNPRRRPSPSRRPTVTASIFMPGGAKKAWEASGRWPGKGRLTSPAVVKAAKAVADKPVAAGNATNAVCVDKRTGLAFYRHTDGRLSPRAL
jgi:hypothetical protein